MEATQVAPFYGSSSEVADTNAKTNDPGECSTNESRYAMQDAHTSTLPPSSEEAARAGNRRTRTQSARRFSQLTGESPMQNKPNRSRRSSQLSHSEQPAQVQNSQQTENHAKRDSRTPGVVQAIDGGDRLIGCVGAAQKPEIQQDVNDTPHKNESKQESAHEAPHKDDSRQHGADETWHNADDKIADAHVKVEGESAKQVATNGSAEQDLLMDLPIHSQLVNMHVIPLNDGAAEAQHQTTAVAPERPVEVKTEPSPGTQFSIPRCAEDEPEPDEPCDNRPKRKRRRLLRTSFRQQGVTYRELDSKTFEEYRRAVEAERCTCKERSCEHKDPVCVAYLVREKIRICQALNELKRACPIAFPDVTFKYHWRTVTGAKSRSQTEQYSQALDECGIKPFYSVASEDECGIYAQRPSVISRLMKLFEAEFSRNCTREERTAFFDWARQVEGARMEHLENIWMLSTETGQHRFVEDFLGCRRRSGYGRPIDVIGTALRSLDGLDMLCPSTDDDSDALMSDSEYFVTFHRSFEPPRAPEPIASVQKDHTTSMGQYRSIEPQRRLKNPHYNQGNWTAAPLRNNAHSAQNTKSYAPKSEAHYLPCVTAQGPYSRSAPHLFGSTAPKVVKLFNSVPDSPRDLAHQLSPVFNT